MTFGWLGGDILPSVENERNIGFKIEKFNPKGMLDGGFGYLTMVVCTMTGTE